MKFKFAIAATLALACGQAMGCDLPSAPGAIPDGKKVSKDVMLAKKKEIDKYKREVEEYLTCEVNPVRAQTAQAELDRVSSRFNAEVRAFKAANGG